VVGQIYDEQAANVLASSPPVTVLMHTGSRGFGHQVCTDTCGMERGDEEVRDPARRPPARLAPFGSDKPRRISARCARRANYAWSTGNVSPSGRARCSGKSSESARDLGCHWSTTWPTTSPRSRSTWSKGVHAPRRPSERARGRFRLTSRAARALPGNRSAGAGPPVTWGVHRCPGRTQERWRRPSEHPATGRAAAQSGRRHQGGKGARSSASWRHVRACTQGERPRLDEGRDARGLQECADVVTVCHNAGISKMVAKLRPLGASRGRGIRIVISNLQFSIEEQRARCPKCKSQI